MINNTKKMIVLASKIEKKLQKSAENQLNDWGGPAPAKVLQFQKLITQICLKSPDFKFEFIINPAWNNQDETGKVDARTGAAIKAAEQFYSCKGIDSCIKAINNHLTEKNKTPVPTPDNGNYR